jgi:N-dimethylarginine dimethylaminohydrolase
MMSYFLCPPMHYAVHFLGNPWLAWHDAVDLDRAWIEWEGLCTLIAATGASTAMVSPQPGASAMTFVRDAALVYSPNQALVLRNDGPRGDVEPRHVTRWFKSQGYRTEMAPYRLDGGNILRCADGRYLVGLKGGAGSRVGRYLAWLLRRHGGAGCIGVPLADPRYLHLDLVLADMAGKGWLVYPEGLGDGKLADPLWQMVFRDRPIITVERDEAARLACNVVVIGETVIGGGLSPRLVRAIERLGLTVAPTPLAEFAKAGGGAHCLTLEAQPL